MFYQTLWFFFVYAFLGWCTEVSYAALHTGKFVNRGFLNGPVCPIYGFGVILVLRALEPLTGNTLLLFLGSMVLTSLLEWLTGFVLEKLFHQRWWDYSEEPFNIGGYICLRFSLMWGLACLFVVKLVHPTILWGVLAIPQTLGWVLLGLFSAAMAVDLAATVRTVARMNRQLSQLDELAGRLKEVSNDLGEHLAVRVLDAAEAGDEMLEDAQKNLNELKAAAEQRRRELQQGMDEVKDSLAQKRFQMQMDQAQWLEDRERDLDDLRTRIEEVRSRYIFGQRRLLAAFPRMRSLDHKKALERLRRWMEQR